MCYKIKLEFFLYFSLFELWKNDRITSITYYMIIIISFIHHFIFGRYIGIILILINFSVRFKSDIDVLEIDQNCEIADRNYWKTEINIFIYFFFSEIDNSIWMYVNRSLSEQSANSPIQFYLNMSYIENKKKQLTKHSLKHKKVKIVILLGIVVQKS
jgi:hypothetical protein